MHPYNSGLFLGAHRWKDAEPALGVVWSFFAGALAAGVATSRPHWKTLNTCAAAMVLIGAGACVVGKAQYRFSTFGQMVIFYLFYW